MAGAGGVAPGAVIVRVCMGPVRSAWGLLRDQSSEPDRLSNKPRCSANTSAPHRSKLRVLGRPDSGCADRTVKWARVGWGSAVLMA